jgi:hypothetical protein
MSQLTPCRSCQRHVRVTDDRCPFCGVELSAEQRASAPRPLPGRRLGRAALFAFGATMVGAAACSDGSGGGKDASTDTPAADGSAGKGGSGGTGGQGGSGGSGTGGSGGSADGGSGGSGGKDGAADSATDKGETGGTGGIAPPYGIAPLYGAPPANDAN